MSLLKKNTIKKGKTDKNAIQLEFEANNNEKYKVKSIEDNTIYAKKLKTDYLLKLYNLIF